LRVWCIAELKVFTCLFVCLFTYGVGD
jgi:hypothetical protein